MKLYSSLIIVILRFPLTDKVLKMQLLFEWITNSHCSTTLKSHHPLLFWTVAVDKLPNFLAAPTPDGKPGPHHQCSIHLNCESVEVLETAYKESINGKYSTRSALVHALMGVMTHKHTSTHARTHANKDTACPSSTLGVPLLTGQCWRWPSPLCWIPL